MIWFAKNHTYSIGVDVGDDNLRVVQLGNNGNGISLIDGGYENRPVSIKAGSIEWQRWVIETIRQITARGKFYGRDVIAALPADEVFIDHIRIPKSEGAELDDAIFSKIKQKLPFEPIRENTMLKYIPTEDNNALVMATERKIIDRHLAIYEKSGLKIKSIGVWPMALTNTYARFFGRRKTDIQAIVMLVCIESNCTNVVICRHKNLLFARSIAIGAKQLNGQAYHKSDEDSSDDEKTMTRLVFELTACKNLFISIHRSAQIERLVFLSGQPVDKQTYTTIAKQLEMPAQIGDCFAAVEVTEPWRLGVDRRLSGQSGRGPTDSAEASNQKKEQINWATAFGLSLSSEQKY
jgi:Tfp pilus assembly PilM family ATPase